MHVERYEQMWIGVSAVFLAALVGVIAYTTFGMGVHLQGTTSAAMAAETAMPAMTGQEQDAGAHSGMMPAAHVKVDEPPFDQPGLRRVGENKYEAVLAVKAWQFTPAQLEVPAGATVTFLLTSGDVIHGFRMPGTLLNTMIVPGQLSRVTYTFHRPGVYTFFCHEYCGVGHQAMSGTLTVK